MNSKRNILQGLVLGLGLCAFLFLISVDRVQAAQAERVLVTVLTASNEGNDFDLDNDVYRDELINLFSYSSYNQKDQKALTLNRSQRKVLSLPEGYELVLSLIEGGNQRILIQAVIRSGNTVFVDTVLSLLKPGVVFLGGPPAEGGVLILVLEAP